VHLYQVVFYFIGTLPLVGAERALKRQTQTVYFPNVSLMFLKSFKGFSASFAAILPTTRRATMSGRLSFLGVCK